MADIIKEAGLSAGSIYSHFESKEELLRFAATTVLEAQADFIEEILAAERAVTPSSLVDHLAKRISDMMPWHAMIQIWGEIARDSNLRQIATEMVTNVRALLTRALGAWASHHREDDTTARLLAEQAADTVLTTLHGYMIRAVIDRNIKPELLLRTLTAGLENLEQRLPVS